MTHLLVHLVKEISILGLVFLHNMFPFERFMGVLKKCVHNRAHTEGSIAKGYGTEEVIEFCVDFIPYTSDNCSGERSGRKEAISRYFRASILN